MGLNEYTAGKLRESPYQRSVSKLRVLEDLQLELQSSQSMSEHVSEQVKL